MVFFFVREHAVFSYGRTRSYEWRARQLAGLSRLLEERSDELAAAIGADLGRPPVEARLFDLYPTKTALRHARKNLRRWMRPCRVPVPPSVLPGRAWYEFEPVGVVLIVAPWNSPVHLALAPLIASLAAGNCAVIKPSEIAPACSSILARLLPRYLEPGAVTVVEGGAEASLGLLGQGVDHCSFTGNPAIGRAVMAAAAPHLTPVTLELGGKCPAIVTSSARLNVAARRIAFGKLVNSGRPVPVVNERHAARLARLLRGGAVDVKGALVQPTVVVDPDPGAPILSEEIFGPVLPVVTVDSVDQAIARIKCGGRPLATYLFSKERRDEGRLLRGVISGGTVVNHVLMHLSVDDLPFGGVGASGMGRYHGRWGFERLSNARAVLRKPIRPDLPLFYPPYGGLANRIAGRVLR